MALQTGTNAPAFSLKHKHSEGLDDISLESGTKTVLLFFPLAFTGVCMEEMCTIRDTLSDYEGLGATVYGISVDSPFTLEVMAKQEKINFKLLSDFNRDASKAYDVLDDNFVPAKLGFQGVSKRSAFVIGEDGVITYSWSSDNPATLPPFDEIKAALD
ncbi:MAG: redoxin domain-containing protein [Opitutae bacterium]